MILHDSREPTLMRRTIQWCTPFVHSCCVERCYQRVTRARRLHHRSRWNRRSSKVHMLRQRQPAARTKNTRRVSSFYLIDTVRLRERKKEREAEKKSTSTGVKITFTVNWIVKWFAWWLLTHFLLFVNLWSLQCVTLHLLFTFIWHIELHKLQQNRPKQDNHCICVVFSSHTNHSHCL